MVVNKEKNMNVGDLKKMLESYPDGMEIVNVRYSDYQIIELDEWHLIKGVPNDGWVMGSHETMSEDNKRAEKKYLCLCGN